jgi:hypothetical protein
MIKKVRFASDSLVERAERDSNPRFPRQKDNAFRERARARKGDCGNPANFSSCAQFSPRGAFHQLTELGLDPRGKFDGSEFVASNY